MQAAAPIPILRSFDEALARAFYIEFLGFEVTFEYRHEPDTPLYLGLRLDQCVLHLSEHFGDASPGSAVRIEVDDVDAYCAALNAKQYRHARPGIQVQPWGYREMMIDDPFGNRLVFCTESD
ncbi:MAG: glyoxalase superfamily protein [Pseudomonadota bacterium]